MRTDLFKMLDNQLKLNRRRDLNERTLEGETLILDRTNGQIHHLNSDSELCVEAVRRLISHRNR